MRNKKAKRTVKKAVVPGRKTAKPAERSPTGFMINVISALAAFILADLLAILYFNQKPAIIPAAAQVTAVAYKNPEYEKLKNLPAGGTVKMKLPVVNDLKFIMSDEPVFAGADPVYSLNVCCPAGLSKDFYTAKMPWAFIMYDFEPGLPTVVLFEMNSEKKEGRFEIVILDPKGNMESLKAVSVRIFTQLVKQYKPDYEWKSSVRQEIN